MTRLGRGEWAPADKQEPNREWQIARGGKRYGPVQFDVLIRGLDSGTILPSDLVWTPGLPNWIPITELVSPNRGDAKRQPSNGPSRKTGQTSGTSEEPTPDGRISPVSDSSPADIRGTKNVRKGRPIANSLLTLLRTDLNRAWKAGSAASGNVWQRLRPLKAGGEARAPLGEVLRVPGSQQDRDQGEIARNEAPTGASSLEERVKGKVIQWTKSVTRLEGRKIGNAIDRLEQRWFGSIESELDPRRAIRKLNLVGLALTILLIGGFGGWAATSRLAGAVIAPGTLVVESSVKKVQHPTGGVVGEIFVKEGGSVEAGQVVLRLDDTVTRATLGVVRSQLDEWTAREARLLAERDGADSITFPSQLESRRDEASVTTALAGEERLFDARKMARTGQRAQLRERIAQLGEEVRGLSAQKAAKETEIELIEKELVGVTDLYKKNLVSISRYMQLNREQTRLQGERGQLIAEIARSRGKTSETELQIMQLDQDFRTEVLKDQREAQGKIAELKERVTAAEDQLKRVELRAPQSGVVHQLSVHTVGGVVGNGETIMQIVPRADDLVVEAKVAPQDIDQVATGTKVSVRIMASNQRTTPDLIGILTRVSADLTREQQNGGQPAQSFYTVRIELPADQIARLKDIHLVPGMPAEAFIQTHERTPLQYLLKPLEEQITRAFRER